MLDNIHILATPNPMTTANSVRGEIVYIDRFGNAMTNISLKEIKWPSVSVKVGSHKVPIKPYFSAGEEGELFAVWNSSQILELAVFNDSAERLHHLKLGIKIAISGI